MRDTDVGLLRAEKWQFDWRLELSDKSREVYKLTTKENPSVIQGLMSLSDQTDHIFLHLLEKCSI